jgi:type 1 glutamine amidotransferase
VRTTPAPTSKAAPKPIIDLLPYIDPQLDTVSGTWTMQEGALVASNAPFQRIEIPYQPPEEYDFSVNLMLTDAPASAVQMLARSARSFAWIMGDWEGNALFGFDLVGGAQGNANPTTCRPPAGLAPGSEYVSQVMVRNNGLRAYLNGALISQWQTDYRDMDIRTEWKLRNPALLGLGSRGGPIIFNRVEVVEVNGYGRFTRSTPAGLGKSGAAPVFEIASRLQAAVRSRFVGDEIRVLMVTHAVVSSQDAPSHDWQATTDALRDELQKDPRMKVETLEDPCQLDSFDLTRFRVMFLHFDNKGKPEPSAKARGNLKDFVNRGGGLVVFHAACAAFPNWSGYRDVAGRVWDPSKNTFDPMRTMQVSITNTNHPITRAMQSFQTVDELFACLTGGKRVEVLATAQAQSTKRDEPMVFVFNYGKGRVFHTVLGHNAAAIRAPGTAELIRRGCAWAAGREPVPTTAIRQPPQ